MPRIQFHRPSHEFDELAREWEIVDERLRDMRRCVLQGDLRPFLIVYCRLQPVEVGDGPLASVGELEEVRATVWVALEYAIPIGNLEAVFPAFRSTEVPGPDTRYWAAPVNAKGGPFTLTDVLASCMVSDENKRELEARMGVTDAAPLDKRKAVTLSKMVVAMYADRYDWKPGDAECRGASDLVEAAEAVGLKLSVPTVRTHLLECVALAQPKLIPGRPALAAAR